MNKSKLLKMYNKNYTDDRFYETNIAYAFSEAQLKKAMKKLGATDRSELTSIYGIGDLCLKSKAQEIITWISSSHQERIDWLKGLTDEEKEAVIEYELYNHECFYTRDLEPVVNKFLLVYGEEQIVKVFNKIRK